MNNFDGQNRKWFVLCSPNLCTHNSGSKVKKEEAISQKYYCYVSLIHNRTVHIYAMPPWENTAKAEQKGHTFTQETEAMSWTCKHPRGGWNHPMNAPLICWHPSLVLLSPGRGWLQLQAVSIGQWCWSAHRFAKALVSQVCTTRCLGLGWPGGAKAFPWKKIPQNSQFHFFFTFSFQAESACHCQIYRPRLLRSTAGGRSFLLPTGQVQWLSFKLQLHVSWKSWMCMFQPWSAAGQEASRSHTSATRDGCFLPLVVGVTQETARLQR